MSTTTIEWLGGGKSWNPVTGCTPVSRGCDHCYARTFARRLQAMGTPGYEKGFAVTLHPDKLDDPLHWRKPCRIFVCSMGDPFHDDVPTSFIDLVLETIAACRRHTFIALTKRAQNLEPKLYGEDGDYKCRNLGGGDYLPNLWLGVSVEDQATFDERWAALRDCPAAIYVIFYEPALGPLILPADFLALGRRAWVICGGETGPGARPMDPDWARKVRDDCAGAPAPRSASQSRAGVPFFFKSWGRWIPFVCGENRDYPEMFAGQHGRMDGSPDVAGSTYQIPDDLSSVHWPYKDGDMYWQDRNWLRQQYDGLNGYRFSHRLLDGRTQTASPGVTQCPSDAAPPVTARPGEACPAYRTGRLPDRQAGEVSNER